MNKKEFLATLSKELRLLPKEDKRKWLDYYSEMISDRMEEGLPEQEAVAAIGSAELIAAQIVGETDPSLIASEKKKRELNAWQIALLVLGSPLWISLLAAAGCVVLALAIAAFAVVLSVYIVIWAVVISLYSVVLALALGGVAALVLGVLKTPTDPAGGVFVLGTSLVCLGAAILLFLGANQVAKGAVWLSKNIFLGIVSCFKKKEERK